MNWIARTLLVAVVAAGTFEPTLAGNMGSSPEDAEPNAAPAREPNREFAEAITHAGAWLLEHGDERKRAAGLLYRVDAGVRLEAQAELVEQVTTDDELQEHGSIRRAALDALRRAEARVDGMGALEPDELLDRFERVIGSTTDGAALAWLAAACTTAGIEAFCIDAGLDDAIVRHDGANLLSRLTLVPDASTEIRNRLIVEAETTRNDFGPLTAVWFEALDEAPGPIRLEPSEKLGGAFAMSMAQGIPAYAPIAEACDAELIAGGEHRRACSRIADQLMSDSRTLIGQMIGFGLASSVAGAGDDEAAVERLEQRKIYENAVFHCRANALSPALENFDDAEARNFIRMLDERGEIEAYERLAAQQDIDCSDPDVPGADAMEDFATALEGES